MPTFNTDAFIIAYFAMIAVVIVLKFLHCRDLIIVLRYVAGSKVGSLFMKGAKVVRDKAVKAVHTVANAARNLADRARNGIRNFFSAFAF